MMKIAESTYKLGPTFGMGSNSRGGEILIAPLEMVDPSILRSPEISIRKGKTMFQAVPDWNRRLAKKYDDGVVRDWVYTSVRLLDPKGYPEDGGPNPLCHAFPGWLDGTRQQLKEGTVFVKHYFGKIAQATVAWDAEAQTCVRTVYYRSGETEKKNISLEEGTITVKDWDYTTVRSSDDIDVARLDAPAFC